MRYKMYHLFELLLEELLAIMSHDGCISVGYSTTNPPRFCYIFVHCIHLGIITYKRIFDLESSTCIKHNRK